MATVPKEIIELNDEIYKENGEREQLLRAKCRWEQRSRCGILMEYGDPKDWNAPIPPKAEVPV